MNTDNYQPHQQRVIKELKKLKKKIEPLKEFISKGRIDNVAEAERILLREQLATMTDYAGILEDRIATWGRDAEGRERAAIAVMESAPQFDPADPAPFLAYVYGAYGIKQIDINISKGELRLVTDNEGPTVVIGGVDLSRELIDTVGSAMREIEAAAKVVKEKTDKLSRHMDQMSPEGKSAFLLDYLRDICNGNADNFVARDLGCTSSQVPFDQDSLDRATAGGDTTGVHMMVMHPDRMELLSGTFEKAMDEHLERVEREPILPEGPFEIKPSMHIPQPSAEELHRKYAKKSYLEFRETTMAGINLLSNLYEMTEANIPGSGKVFANITLAKTHLEDCYMRMGMALRELKALEKKP